MPRNNLDLRHAIEDSGLRQYQVAKAAGIGECSFSRLLRDPIPEDQKSIFLQIVEDLKSGIGTALSA